MRSIAAELGRPPSTISREIGRNTDPATGVYLPHTAHQLATRRRSRPKTTKLAADPVLRSFVDACLGKRFSPEQISHQLTVAFPDDPQRHLAVETLYRAIYHRDASGLTSTAKTSLRTGRRRRRPHRYQRRRSAITDPAVMIDARPASANDRAEPGHLEGDLIIGRNGGSAIGTLVDRTCRYLTLVHLSSAAHRQRYDGCLGAHPGGHSAFVASFFDVGPGEGVSPASGDHESDWHADLFLPRSFAVGTRHRRKHEWFTSPVFSERV